MEKYIYSITSDGEMVASINPEWNQKIQKAKFNFYLENSSIPKDYWGISFEHVGFGYNYRPILICKNYIIKVKKTKKNLYLYGDNSTGKTTAMSLIGKTLIENGFKVKFILMHDLISLLMKTSGYNYNEKLEQEKQKLFKNDIFLIDEVFDSNKSLLWKGESKDQIIGEIDSFFRHCISNDKKMVVTSNIPVERICNDYGRSLYELIDRNFKPIPFKESVKEKRKSQE